MKNILVIIDIEYGTANQSSQVTSYGESDSKGLSLLDLTPRRTPNDTDRSIYEANVNEVGVAFFYTPIQVVVGGSVSTDQITDEWSMACSKANDPSVSGVNAQNTTTQGSQGGNATQGSQGGKGSASTKGMFQSSLIFLFR